MATDELSPSVARFLDNCIDSIEQLQVLLLLHAKPERAWTVPEFTAELRSTDSSIAKRLRDLYKRGVITPLAETQDRHQFRPATPELREIIDCLSVEHERRPFRVIEAIYAQPNKALVAFADAFKLGGSKP